MPLVLATCMLTRLLSHMMKIMEQKMPLGMVKTYVIYMQTHAHTHSHVYVYVTLHGHMATHNCTFEHGLNVKLSCLKWFSKVGIPTRFPALINEPVETERRDASRRHEMQLGSTTGSVATSATSASTASAEVAALSDRTVRAKRAVRVRNAYLTHSSTICQHYEKAARHWDWDRGMRLGNGTGNLQFA